MPSYRVIIEIEEDAETSFDAAQQAYYDLTEGLDEWGVRVQQLDEDGQSLHDERAVVRVLVGRGGPRSWPSR